MTSIILVTIGILLAAAAAMFVIFYGGDAFNAGAYRAQASTLINAGTNVESAVTGYHNDTGADPETLSDLRGDGDAEWLSKGGMQVSNAATGTPEISIRDGIKAFRIAGVSAKVCAYINEGYGIEGEMPTAIGDLRRGCHSAAGDHVFFVRLAYTGPKPPNPDSVTEVVQAGDAALVASAERITSVPTSVSQLGGADYGKWADGAQSSLYEADVPEGGTRMFVFTPMSALHCGALRGDGTVPDLDLSGGGGSCGYFYGQVIHAVDVGSAMVGKARSVLVAGFGAPTPFDYHQYRMNLVAVPRWICNGIQRADGTPVDGDADFARGTGCGRFFGINYYYTTR